MLSSFHHKLLAATFLLSAGFFATKPEARAQLTDAGVESRRLAYDLAGAFANDGFKLRDGFTGDHLESGGASLLAVNLFAGNAYWFTAACLPATSTIAVEIFNEKGEKLTSDDFSEAGRAASGLIPSASGLHFVKVSQVSGDPCDFTLLYSYK
jgi:hypothetical protein